MGWLTEEQVQIVKEVIWIASQEEASVQRQQPRAGALPLVDLELIDTSPSIAECVLVRFIDNLPLEAQAMLLAVMSIGRHDAGQTAVDYPELLEYAKTNTDHMGDYMAGKMALSEYLQDGLKELVPH